MYVLRGGWTFGLVPPPLAFGVSCEVVSRLLVLAHNQNMVCRRVEDRLAGALAWAVVREIQEQAAWAQGMASTPG